MNALAGLFKKNIKAVEKLPPKEEKEINEEVSFFFKQVQNFQKDHIEILRNDRKRAWRFAIISFVVNVLLVAVIAAMGSLKKVIPYTITVDKNTGYTEVAQPISDAKTTYGQEIDKYWLANFVINRESYEWGTIQDMYDRVQLMSSDAVFSEYSANLNNKAASPLYILKDKKKLVTKVLSVSFYDDVAQIRFVKVVKNPDGTPSPEYKESYWIATVAYDYQKTILKEKDRLVNPLGFEITSYRVDSENIEVKH